MPLPSAPRSLFPQHFILVAIVLAQVCQTPAAISTTPLVNPTTSCGETTGLMLVVPFPSWPKKLPPQHLTPPIEVSAQAWSEPAETAITVPDKPTMI